MGSVSDSYVGFLNMFRDSDPDKDSTTIEEARRIPPPPPASAAPAPAAPPAYGAAVQPAYNQPVYNQPVYNQPTYNMAQAQPPAYGTAARPANTAAPKPAKPIGYGDPAPAYSPPPRPHAPPAAYAAPPASAAKQVDTGAGVYPQQSLFDPSKNSADSGSSRPGNVVHPPNAYTPSGSSGAPSEPATEDTAATGAGVYPQQSLSGIFSGK